MNDWNKFLISDLDLLLYDFVMDFCIVWRFLDGFLHHMTISSVEEWEELEAKDWDRRDRNDPLADDSDVFANIDDDVDDDDVDEEEEEGEEAISLFWTDKKNLTEWNKRVLVMLIVWF